MKRILVIERDPALRRSVRERLVNRGFEAIEAGDGPSALEAVRHLQPDLILCGEQTAQNDGSGLFQALNESPGTADIPVIMMSTLADRLWLGDSPASTHRTGVAQSPGEEILKSSGDSTTKILRRRGEPAKERLLAILEVTSDLVAITDLDGRRFLYLNEAGRRMLGLESGAELTGCRMTDFLDASGLELIRRAGIPGAMRDGVWVGETGFRSRSGREFTVSHQILAHTGPNGQPEYLSMIARDITEGKQAIEALQRSEELFRIMTENATELIALVSTSGRRLYNSPAYQKVLGYTPEELQATSSLEQIHPDDRAIVIAAAQEAKTTGIGKFIEYRMRHKDGTWRILESHAGVVRDRRGEIENILIVARDITRRKEAEKQRDLMEIQLRHSQKMESIGQLAAGIAHEINTPTQYIGDNLRFLQEAFVDLQKLLTHQQRLLESIKANAVTPHQIAEVEAAADKADLPYLAAEIPKALEQSLDGVDRVARIVYAMKQFSHPGTEDRVAIDLNKAIESTLTVTHNEWKYIADLTTDLDSTLPMVPCFPGEFNQVILNLIVNAAHAIADKTDGGNTGKGTITVRTRNLGEWAEIRVSDTGTGIPEKVRERIFEPFFTTKAVGRGTGQGLAIAHSVIVEKHGGRIHFETELGVGTTFILALPITPRLDAEGRKSG